MTKLTAILLSIFISVKVTAIPAEAHQIMVSGPSPYAVTTAREIAALGGNVVDVAVAIGLTLSVTSPYYAALGGGGFALVKMGASGPVEALDFRETAPSATGKDYYKSLGKEASVTGGHAVAVPGGPAGLWALHQKYGYLKWEQLFATALGLANKGFPVSAEWVHRTHDEMKRFNEHGKSAFARPAEIEYKPGEMLRQPALTKALLEFKSKNLKGFYQGAVARDLVDSVKASQGALSLEDLKNYKVRWLKPMQAELQGYTVYLMPPPSSGGVVIASALKLMDKLKLKSYARFSVDELHYLAEIESASFRGRALLGDPDFNKNPVGFLLSDTYLDGMAKAVAKGKAGALKPLSSADVPEGHETTHFSVMDKDGNAVALTITLNGIYGSGVVSKKFHIALNDEMDDFTTRPGEANMYGLAQGTANQVEVGKRPLSSMSPTLVTKEGKVIMSLGAPGGPRIITGVLQGLYRSLVQNMDIDSAIQAPRVHHQFLPNKIYVDGGRWAPETLQGLRDRGHQIEEASALAKVYIVRLRDDGILEGAFDARGEGAAGGI